MSTVTYHNGPLVKHIEVVSIYLNLEIYADETRDRNKLVPTGNWLDPELQQVANRLDLFLEDILDSEYTDSLAEYSIGRGKRVGSYFLTAGPFEKNPFIVNEVDALADPAVLDQNKANKSAHVVFVLQQFIGNNTLPFPDPNRCYFVFLPPGVFIGGKGIVDGFHDSFQITMPDNTTSEVFYAVMSHPNSRNPTDPTLPSQQPLNITTPEQFNQLTVVTSHEMVEIVTDPSHDPSRASIGWHTDEKPPDCDREIADLCQTRSFHFHGYSVSPFWSEQQQQCAQCPIQIRLNNNVFCTGGAIVEGQTAHFSVDVPCISQELFYSWTVSGAPMPKVRDKPDFFVTMPPAPSVVTVTVTVATDTTTDCMGRRYPDADVSKTGTFRSITIQDAERFTHLCDILSDLLRYTHVNIFFNPLWDPLRDFAVSPVRIYELREMHHIAEHLSRLTGRLVRSYELEFEQGTDADQAFEEQQNGKAR